MPVVKAGIAMVVSLIAFIDICLMVAASRSDRELERMMGFSDKEAGR